MLHPDPDSEREENVHISAILQNFILREEEAGGPIRPVLLMGAPTLLRHTAAMRDALTMLLLEEFVLDIVQR